MKGMLRLSGVILSLVMTVGGCAGTDQDWQTDIRQARTINVIVQPYRAAVISRTSAPDELMAQIREALDTLLKTRGPQQLASQFVRKLNSLGYTATVSAANGGDRDGDVVISIERPYIEALTQSNGPDGYQFTLVMHASVRITTKQSGKTETFTFHYPQATDAGMPVDEKIFGNANALLAHYTQAMEPGITAFVEKYFSQKEGSDIRK